MTARLVANARESRCLVRRFVLPTSLADRTANQRAQKATSDRLSSSSNPATRSDGVLEYWSVGALRQFGIAPRVRGVGSAFWAQNSIEVSNGWTVLNSNVKALLRRLASSGLRMASHTSPKS